MFLLNSLKTPDWLFFFLVCPIVIILTVGAYFLPMLLRRKQNEQAREELAARERAYKGESASEVVETVEEVTPVEVEAVKEDNQEIDDESL